MKIEDYQLIILLNHSKTIRAAAKKALISQPAITQRLKYIEEYFGTTIFIRTPKQLMLTPEGEAIVKHAGEVLSKEDQLTQQIAEIKDKVAGTLSLGVSSLVSQHTLPSILRIYTQKFPDVKIDLVSAVSAEIKSKAADFHVMIVRGEPLKGLACIPLYKDPLYIFDTAEITGAKERPFIEFKADYEYQQLVECWLHQSSNLNIRRTMKVDHFEVAKKLMVEGLGMTVLPWSLVSEDLMHLYHAPLIVDGSPVHRQTWACVKPDYRRLPQVDAFLHVLEKSSAG
ncbi:LysR family transcriptional regulator [Halobacillus sp. Marseille-Q1614]|uniref:LysR family transcriptional regulator n=1 Tax=Halobacillus sp. Marseille-Q1614 TaxID=2709134 RepID=UPI00156E85E3|nr:LysR family transcriptional regulator [Halobacillus sp. Marseille-Q1614]